MIDSEQTSQSWICRDIFVHALEAYMDSQASKEFDPTSSHHHLVPYFLEKKLNIDPQKRDELIQI